MDRRTYSEELKTRLLALREALSAQLAVGGEEGTADVDPTRAGRLTRLDDLHNQAMGAESMRRRKRELARVEAALQRLEEGEYGECAACGEPIAPARLQVDPAAEQCIRCATRAEEQRR